MTPHIQAKKGEIADTVLLPGDPLRAKFIAENFLEDVTQFNFIRNMFGYTGTYNGKKISVMGSGMGIPSIGIYSYELIHTYGVKNLIRIGSAGSYQKDVNVGDVIIGISASTDSNYIKQFDLNGTFAPTANYELVNKATIAAKNNNINVKVGPIFSSDIFYHANHEMWKKWAKMGILCVEMEAAALYTNAAAAGVNALAILTISDSLVDGSSTTPEEREKTFTNMMKIALEI